MQIKPEELSDNGYFLIDNLNHQQLIPFVRKYLKNHTTFSIFYSVSNVLIVSTIVLWFWKSYGNAIFKISDGFSHFSYGIALAFTLVPLNEYIHVLAHKSQGAENTSNDANWKKFYFFAIADKFVATQKEFQIVALAPFVMISATLIFLLFLSNQLWSFTILGTLLTQTAFTSGDFGPLSYFDFHKEKDIVTYDDKEKGMTYFYEKAE